jgi:ArsR family transcriptional regulator
MNTKLRQEIDRLHAELCGALSDPNRILILYTLSEQASNVSDLADKLNLPQPTTSRHLKILRERGMVVARRKGQSVIYRLADERIITALDLLRSMLADKLETQAALVHNAAEQLSSLN